MVTELLAPSAVRTILPLPGRERWEPLRAGIICVWQYPEQDFVFHRGRLVLMGRNGAGKTKVLELLFPFLLDAQNVARRLSPGGGDGRTWRWNLLEIGKDGTPRRKRGDGIVWLEFGRRGHGGAMEFATIGARLSAVFGSQRVAIAWFLTDQRPGEDLSLTAPLGDDPAKRMPLTRDQLEAAIGEHGHIFDQRTAYRRAIDDRLFHLGGRFDGLMNLLISLRQPKLSEKLDLDKLVTHLRDALPPVDDDQVRQLAEALESLREDDASLERMKRARGAVGRFLDDYRDYATREARAVADRVRATEEGVRQAQRRLHRAEDDAQSAEDEVDRLTRLLADAKTGLERVAGQIAAHAETPEMKAAERLRLAEDAAGTARTRATLQDGTAHAMEEEADAARDIHVLADEAAGTSRDELASTLTSADAAAERAAMTGAQMAYRAALEADGRATADAVNRAIESRRNALAALKATADRLADARSKHQAARDGVIEAARLLRDARSHLQATADELADRRTSLADALVEWAAGLSEITVLEDSIAGLLDAADSGRRLADVAAPLADPARQVISTASGVLDQRERDLATERQHLVDERDEVLATQIARPRPLPTRRASRAERPGAPFYEVVDFRDGLPAADAGGLEAALEAAGILDAWVLPDGGLLAGEDDAAVLANRAVQGASLAGALVPAGDAVSAQVVAQILAAIGLGERADGTWVAMDGRFSLGPIAGAFRKGAAGFIGAGAQALTRAQRVAELEAQIAVIDGQAKAVAGERTVLADRARRIITEIASLPSDRAFADTRRTLRERDSDVRGAEDNQTRSDDRERSLGELVGGLTNQLAESIAGLGFPPGQTDVTGALHALTDYRGAVLELGQAAREAARSTAALETARRTLDRVQGKAEAARAEHASAEREASHQEAMAAELRSTHGASAEAAMARLRDLKGEQTRLGRERDDTDRLLGPAHETRGRTASELEGQKHRVTEAESKRADAAAAFGRFAATALFGLATDYLLEGDPRGWAVRRIVETARAAIDTEDRASFEPSARISVRRTVHTRFSDLQSEIGADFGLSIDPTTDDDLLLVDAQHGDDRVPIASLASFLDRTIAEQEGQLDARSREILSRYLFDGVGEELGDRIREARGLIDGMNAELTKRPTASGLRIFLRWDLAPSIPERATDATNLLLTQTALLHENDRKRIVDFLQSRVTEARELEDSRGFSDALVEALDYRNWFAFAIEEILPGGRHHRLNPRDFPTGSGGEKAVTLHLPLFAAVAAYYTGAAAQAPRLFFLDEAFAGIDRPMRGSMMGFIVRFDLDFVITTPDDWATYAELDGTAIYQLFRDPAERGVYAQRWTWTGVELLDEEALRALDEAAG